MTFTEFKDLISLMLDELPPETLNGLQGIHVFEHAKPDPQETGLVRLGEYLDPGPDHFLMPYTHLGRHVALYYGSFVLVSGKRPNFDWDAQIWETLTHEIQHHLESRAGERGLIEWDIEQLASYRAKKREEQKVKQFWRSSS